MDVNVLEQVPVAPPPEVTAGISLPLTFLDLLWLHLSPVHRLIFYQHPVSKTHFLDTLIPKIKNSLSRSLQHYSPLAGRIIISPENQSLPEIRYVDRDTVPLIIAECNLGEGHFGHLTSDHGKSCTEFHPLVPSLPSSSRAEDGSTIVPVLALQVTLFPDVGICIGVTNHHGIGDASSIFRFMKAWEFFSNEKTSSVSLLPPEFQPFYDRTVIRDPRGLEPLFWDNIKNIKIEDTHVHRLPLITDRVRATFTLTRNDIQRLKNHILAKRPELTHISSFTVIYSFVWTCLVKSRYEEDQDNIDDEDEICGCAAECRARLDPPVPGNYFGNCITACVGYAKTKQLMGEEGLANAAAVVGESIRRQLYDEESGGVLKGAESWFELFSSVDRALSVAGSPKFDYYELDFGWGKPTKFEMPSTDFIGAISLSKSKNHEGGLEVGLSLINTQIDSFTRAFTQGLKAL